MLPTDSPLLGAERFAQVREDALARMEKVATRADGGRREADVKVGDRVVVHRKALGEEKPSPLHPQFAGPLDVEAVDEHGNVVVSRGPTMRHIHPESLKVVKAPAPDEETPNDDTDMLGASDGEWEVEKITDCNVDGRTVRLQLHYSGFPEPAEQDNWELASKLKISELFEDYLKGELKRIREVSPAWEAHLRTSLEKMKKREA